MSSVTSNPQTPRQRVLTLQGGCNFRDIGGYATADGRTVKWDRVYRTGVLSYFTANDHPVLQRLGVRAICDLRRPEEREHEPTRWPDAAVNAVSWEDGENPPMIRRFAAQRPNTAAGMRAAMIDLYRALPQWMAPRIRGLCECIATDQTPLIVHCAAGKDRTGIAVAVLLSTLGVANDAIIADYLLTNEAGNFEQFILARSDSHLGLAAAHHPLLAMPADVRRVLFSADADFLQAALGHIDAEFGSVQAYLERCVRLEPAIVERVREALLV